MMAMTDTMQKLACHAVALTALSHAKWHSMLTHQPSHDLQEPIAAARGSCDACRRFNSCR